MPSSLGDRGCVQRPGAPEREQREASRVDAALDGDDPKGPDHSLVGDLEDPGGRVERLESRAGGQAGDRGLGGLVVERRLPPASPAFGSRWPSIRFASVTVGSVPPLP